MKNQVNELRNFRMQAHAPANNNQLSDSIKLLRFHARKHRYITIAITNYIISTNI